MPDTGLTGPHPDIRDQICDMANMLANQHPERNIWPARPFTPDDLTILGQRTWNGITSINHVIDGGGVSALLVSAEIGGKRYDGLVTAGRKADTESWGLMAANFGPARAGFSASGNLGGGGHTCIAFHGSSMGYVQNINVVEIEYADGTIHRAAQEADGCTVLFAPVERWEQKDNRVVTRYLAADGAILHTDTRWLGAGMGPPEDHNEEQP